MTRPSNTHHNPAVLIDAVRESNYAHGWGRGYQLRAERERVIRLLTRKRGDDEAVRDLCERLENCRRNIRCNSAACPECCAAAQRFMAQMIGSYLRSKGEKIARVSLVPLDGATHPGNLTAGEHVRRVRRWKDRLTHAGIHWFVGASDWSFNEHAEGRYAPHWEEHIYGFTAASDLPALRQRLLAQFPRCDAVPRPVSVKEWDGKLRALRYAFKPTFWRRIASDHNERPSASGSVRIYRDTDKQRLLAWQRCELLMHMDELGFQGRLFLRWAQFTNLLDVGPTLQDRAPRRIPDLC